MKTCTAGDGSDSTAAVLAWLTANRKLRLATVYLIGDAEDPMALWLTDYEAPLCWPCWTANKVSAGVPNAFDPATITRGTVTTKIGLDVQTLDVTWSPRPQAWTTSLATASPYQLANLGYFDNKMVRAWTAYMPTPGDANTFGCSELFGGRIADATTARGGIQFQVNSFLDVVNQYVPTNVIELLNTAAAYKGATPPAGFAHVPQFNVVTGDSTNVVIGDQTYPNPHSILNTNNCQGGYLVFNQINPNPTANPPVPGSTLGGVWAAIQQNIQVTVGGTNYNQFILYSQLPWPPTPGADTFYVSAASPINQADGDFLGFPYVPSPTSSL